ncbi:MAG: NAD(P)-binding protein [Candidatus Omnitrophota bacterium]|nr:NAD(P)-binding protein [Candidatus Omnitrophota bacterium]
MNKRILIIGAGPTGLGAAWRLNELGHNNWQIYEQNSYVGGLSASFRDEKGFTWDIGGHVLFSHYEYFDRLFEKLLKQDYLELKRRAYIWACGRLVPYPFQNNIRYLPGKKMQECLFGLLGARLQKTGAAANFKEWILANFGKGIAKYFMLPHNSKVWAHPLEEMSYAWVGDRVSVVDLKRIIGNIVFSREDASWGPNSRFKFPLYGGTGGLFEKFVPYIKQNLALNKKVKRIESKYKKIIFDDNSEDNFDFLINTMPLDQFICRSDLKELQPAAGELKHNGVLVVGIGIKKKSPSGKCWVYFPENNAPFYRLTYFSNYSFNNVPSGDYYSLMCESSYSQHRVLDRETIIENTIQGLINTKILSVEDREDIVSTYVIDAEYAYPIPTLSREELLKNIHPYLEEKDIYSRGRFGAWKYEIGNMDHCVMQGAGTVNKILERC